MKTWEEFCPFPGLFQPHHQSWSPLYRILLNLHTEHSNKFCWLPPALWHRSRLSFQSEELPTIQGAKYRSISFSHFLLRSRQWEEQREREQCSVTRWRGDRLTRWDSGRGSSGRTQDRSSQDSQAVRPHLAGQAGIAVYLMKERIFLEGKRKV